MTPRAIRLFRAHRLVPAPRSADVVTRTAREPHARDGDNVRNRRSRAGAGAECPSRPLPPRPDVSTVYQPLRSTHHGSRFSVAIQMTMPTDSRRSQSNARRLLNGRMMIQPGANVRPEFFHLVGQRVRGNYGAPSAFDTQVEESGFARNSWDHPSAAAQHLHAIHDHLRPEPFTAALDAHAPAPRHSDRRHERGRTPGARTRTHERDERISTT